MELELIEMAQQEFADLTRDKCISYCTAEFQELNSYKIEKLLFFVAKDKKYRLAVSFGEKDGIWFAPFSAPFTSFIELQNYVELDYYWKFVQLLRKEAEKRSIACIDLLLPPDIYNNQGNAKTINSLLGNQFKLVYQEVNYSFNLADIDMESYRESIRHNARKNLSRALKSELCLIHCKTVHEKTTAYSIIKRNREENGYALAMSQNQVFDTGKIIDQDYFLVQNNSNVYIAAAIVFRIDRHCVQVVYWGDIRDEGQYRPINFLAYELIKYYKSCGYSVLDIGPSSKAGEPNFGLCEFKESIGCIVSSKYRYRCELDGKK